MFKGVLNYACNQSKCKVLSCEYFRFLCLGFRALCNEGDISNNYDFSINFPNELKQKFSTFFTIFENFISIPEEESFLSEIEPILKRIKYSFLHWDNAIQGYREIERSNWNPSNSKILNSLRNHVFSNESYLPHVHVLDLHETGHIKPHIDSTRFCGEIISGLNLLSQAVMRFQHESGYYCDVLINRRSMYTMQGPARHEFTHEILSNERSIFKDTKFAFEEVSQYGKLVQHAYEWGGDGSRPEGLENMRNALSGKQLLLNKLML